MLHILLHIF